MSIDGVLDLVACAGDLAVCIFVLLRPAASPLALPLGLLALDLSAWTFADFAFRVSGRVGWHYLDLGLSPLAMPLTLQVVVTFVGRWRKAWPTVLCAYLVTAMLASGGWLAFHFPSMRTWITSLAYRTEYVAGQMLLLLACVTILLRHLKRTTARDERQRTKIMLLALIAGTSLGMTDLINNYCLMVPCLANLATLISMVLMAMGCLRLKMLGDNLPWRLALAAVLMSALGIACYIVVFHLAGNDSRAIVMIATAIITLALLAASRHLVHVSGRYRGHVEELTTLGRFSAQMAHDIKNPLAALQGAIQFLAGEVAAGRPLERQQEFLALIAQQGERIHRIVSDYQRLGRLHVHRETSDVNELVREVVALQRFAAEQVRLELLLDERVPACDLDRDLVGRAIENLIRNAVEAMAGEGVLTVRTTAVGGTRPGVAISVKDTGKGMNARDAERAFDEFFTTKAQGSGLGLAFVKRVAQTHLGSVKLSSRLNHGTIVTLRLRAR